MPQSARHRIIAMKKNPQLIPLLNFFAETLEESNLSQAEIALIPAWRP